MIASTSSVNPSTTHPLHAAFLDLDRPLGIRPVTQTEIIADGVFHQLGREFLLERPKQTREQRSLIFSVAIGEGFLVSQIEQFPVPEILNCQLCQFRRLPVRITVAQTCGPASELRGGERDAKGHRQLPAFGKHGALGHAVKRATQMNGQNVDVVMQ